MMWGTIWATVTWVTVTILVTAMMWVTAMCLLETKELALTLRLSESVLWADYHLSLLCSHMDQQSLLPLLESIVWCGRTRYPPIKWHGHILLCLTLSPQAWVPDKSKYLMNWPLVWYDVSVCTGERWITASRTIFSSNIINSQSLDTWLRSSAIW